MLNQHSSYTHSRSSRNSGVFTRAVSRGDWDAIDAALSQLDPQAIQRLYAWARTNDALDDAARWSLALRCLRRGRRDWRSWLKAHLGRAVPGLTMLIDLALEGPRDAFELRWRELERGAHDPVAVDLGFAGAVYSYYEDAPGQPDSMDALRDQLQAMTTRGWIEGTQEVRLGARLPGLPAWR